MESSNTGPGRRLKAAAEEVPFRILALCALLGFCILAMSAGWREGPPGGPDGEPVPAERAAQQHWTGLYASLPLSFEPNQGQADCRVKFLARGQGYTVFLSSSEAVLSLRPGIRSGEGKRSDLVVRLELVHANPRVRVTGEEALGGQSNYFLGNNPKRWRTHIPTYAKVAYREVYRGVDLVYYGHQGQLEYDFVVAPGADPKAVMVGARLAAPFLPDSSTPHAQPSSSLRGTQQVAPLLAENGDLVLRGERGEVRFERPVAYQGSGRGKRWVAARYVLRGRNRIGFEVGDYDRGKPLIIDPVLSYSTYLGGSGGDLAYGIAVDSSGNALITGITNSKDFPTKSAEQGSSGGNGDAFVAKLNSTGTALVYSTYLGGSETDTATGIATNATGDAFVTGSTTSADFPTTTGAFQTIYKGNQDAFVTQLSSGGDKLVYSSYLGGSGADAGQAIAVDSSGNAYVTGSTQSGDFPTLTPLQPANGGASDAFIAKVNFAGSALVYSTYLGGTAADVGQGVAVDKSGDAYVVGYTFSTDFPTQSPLPSGSANAGPPDVFVAEVKADGSAKVFSTYLGGSGDDRGYGIAVDASGGIYVTGATHSTNFPTTSTALQTSSGGGGDAFVSKLSSGGSAISYSTYLGGSGNDQGNAIAVDASGNAFVAGFTQSSDFPTVNPVQAQFGISGGGSCPSPPCADAFVSELTSSGSALSFSTFLGGSGADFGQALVLDSSGDPYVAGSTSSTNFPAVAGTLQSSLGGAAGNAFVAKIAPTTDAPAIAIAPAKVNFGNQPVGVRSAAQTVSVINVGSQPLTITQITSSSTDFAETDDCVGTVSTAGGNCSINITFTPSTTTAETDQISITDNVSGSPHIITVSGTGATAATAVTVSPTSLTFANQSVGAVSSPQTVTITNTGTAALNITQISAGGDFHQTNTCSANFLSVGASCTVSVTFAPTASGARSGTLSISDNATGSPQSVSLSGTGVAVFSLASTAASTTVVIGSTSATFPVSASAPSNFTGSITLSCTASSGATCSFSSSPIFAGQTSTLTVSNLTASTPNPFNFTLNGTSGSQTATLSLTILFQDYSISVSPALDTITSGSPAGYTVTVSPLNGFNQQVNMGCSNLPSGASCLFSPTSVTPKGSAVTVTLTVNTTKSSTSAAPPRSPLGGAPPPVVLWLVCLGLGALGSLLSCQRRWGARPFTLLGPLAFWPRLLALNLVLALALVFPACRGANLGSGGGGTAPGNYTITIGGTLNSNTSVVRSTTVNLAVTPTT